MIVPRWEWRTFGDDLGEAERRLDALTPTKAEDSDEVYVLSRRTEASVKVRDGQLDVKRLERGEWLRQGRPNAEAAERLHRAATLAGGCERRVSARPSTSQLIRLDGRLSDGVPGVPLLDQPAAGGL